MLHFCHRNVTIKKFKVFFNGDKRDKAKAVHHSGIRALQHQTQQKQNGMLTLPRG